MFIPSFADVDTWERNENGSLSWRHLGTENYFGICKERDGYYWYIGCGAEPEPVAESEAGYATEREAFEALVDYHERLHIRGMAQQVTKYAAAHHTSVEALCE